MTYLLTDVIGEVYGKQAAHTLPTYRRSVRLGRLLSQLTGALSRLGCTLSQLTGAQAARKTVQAGFITQLIAMVFIFITIQLPAAPAFGLQTEFEQILGGSYQVIVASLVSYLASQNLDVTIFHQLRARHGEKKQNNISTMTSQFIDTILFIIIAFTGMVPVDVLIGIILTQYVFKLIIALVDTPFVYLLVKWARTKENKKFSVAG